MMPVIRFVTVLKMWKQFKTKKMQLLDRIEQGGFIVHYKVQRSTLNNYRNNNYSKYHLLLFKKSVALETRLAHGYRRLPRFL